MATKTWKLGELCKGGVITVDTKGDNITVIGKEWDMSKGTRKSSDQSKAKEFTRATFNTNNSDAPRGLFMFLGDLTTSYYADQIMEWIKTKTNLKNIW